MRPSCTEGLISPLSVGNRQFVRLLAIDDMCKYPPQLNALVREKYPDSSISTFAVNLDYIKIPAQVGWVKLSDLDLEGEMQWRDSLEAIQDNTEAKFIIRTRIQRVDSVAHALFIQDRPEELLPVK